MNSKNIVIVDLDGTLVDYRLRAYLCFLKATSNTLKVPISFENYVDSRRRGMSNLELFISLVHTRHKDDSFLALWLEFIEDSELLKYDKLFEDSLNWLQLTSAHSKLILCTARRNHESMQEQIRNFGIAVFFHDVITLSEGETKSKAIAKVLMRDEIYHRKIHFVGDTRSDLIEGFALGAKLHFVERGFTDAKMVTDFTCTSIGRILPAIEL